MGMFNDLLHSFKEVCDQKDEEIKRLKAEIDFRNEELVTIIKRFEEGRYDLLKEYFGV